MTDQRPQATAIWPSLGPVTRLDEALQALFPTLVWSRSAGKRLCKLGAVSLNEQVAGPSRWVNGGDVISLASNEVGARVVFNQVVRVLFEDDHMAVVHKPAGIPTSGNRWRTLANALPFNLQRSTEPDALDQPWPAHRLDAPTTGLVAVGKTGSALAELNRAFAQRRVHKTYAALVRGDIGLASGEVLQLSASLDGCEAQTEVMAITRVRSVKCEWITEVRASPRTGRTHQIRRHLADIGHPIMGDASYTDSPPLLRGCGLYLSAIGIALDHPRGGHRVAVDVAVPNKFASLLRRASAASKRAQMAKL